MRIGEDNTTRMQWMNSDSGRSIPMCPLSWKYDQVLGVHPPHMLYPIEPGRCVNVNVDKSLLLLLFYLPTVVRPSNIFGTTNRRSMISALSARSIYRVTRQELWNRFQQVCTSNRTLFVSIALHSRLPWRKKQPGPSAVWSSTNK